MSLKKESTYSAVSTSSQDDHSLSGQQPRPSSIPAQESSKQCQNFPLIASVAIFGSLLCWILMGVVLFLAHNDNVDNWFPQPNVYLSILSVTSIAFLHLAHRHGSAIQWWIEVNRLETQTEKDPPDGEKLLDEKLGKAQDFWKSTNSIQSAIRSIRSKEKTFSTLSAACLILSILPASSPLLQRASIVVSAPAKLNFPTNLTIYSRTDLPDDFTGELGPARNVVGLTPTFTNIVSHWDANQHLDLDSGTCISGNCSTTVNGIGLRSICSSSMGNYYFAPVPEVPSAVFYIDFSFSRTAASPGSLMNLTVIQKQKGTTGSTQGSCSFTMNITTCTFYPAVVDYNILSDGNHISLNPFSNHTDDKMVNESIPYDADSWSGVWLLLSTLYKSTSNLTYSKETGNYSVGSAGFQSFLYLDNSSSLPCQQSWGDPVFTLLESIRYLMFTVAVWNTGRDDDNREERNVIAIDTPLFVYQSDYWFLGLSMIVSGLSVGVILWMVSQWRSPNRRVDLSPATFAEMFNPDLDTKKIREKEKNFVDNFMDRSFVKKDNFLSDLLGWLFG